MFRLFRPSTRDRFGAEFEDLIEELIGSGDAAWHLFVEVGLAAGRDRLDGLRRTGRAVFAGTIVVTAALVVTTWALVDSRPSPNPSTVVAVVHPVAIAAKSGLGPAGCPKRPQLSAPLPAGASVSPPMQPAHGPSSLLVAGHVYSGQDLCNYTLTLPQG
jgi:hypothetical protein